MPLFYIGDVQVVGRALAAHRDSITVTCFGLLNILLFKGREEVHKVSIL